MAELVSKLPQIYPKIRRITKSSPSHMSCTEEKGIQRSEKDSFCYVCDKSVAKDGPEKTVNILTDITSRMNRVSNVLGLILKTSYVTENTSCLCISCFASIDQYDNLQCELSSLEIDMVRRLATSQQEREARYIYGEMNETEHVDMQNVWLSRVSVRVTQDSAQSDLHEDRVISRQDLPTVQDENIAIASHLPEVDICIEESQIQLLGLAVSNLDGNCIVPLTHLLQLSPQFSLCPQKKLSVQILAKPGVERSSDGSKLECQDCQFVTEYFHLLLPHLETHLQQQGGNDISHIGAAEEGSVKPECDQCGKIFKKTDVLEAHIKKVHQGVNAPWICSFCEKGFTRKASLEEHIARHKGVKQRYCVECDKYFYHTAYWRHLTSVHPKQEKLRHNCPHCGKVFALKFKLDIHLQSHMDHTEKKYCCEQCPDKRFASDEKLRNHKRNVHSKQAAVSHLCGECGASYTNYPALYQHTKRTHHSSLLTNRNTEQQHKKPFICGFDGCDEGFISIKHLQHHQLNEHKGAIEEEHEGDDIIFQGDIHDDDDHHQTGIEDTQAVDLTQQSARSMDMKMFEQNISVKEKDICLTNLTGHLVGDYSDNHSEAQEVFMKSEPEQHSDGDKQETTAEFDNIVNIDMNEQNTIILTEDQGNELIKALNIEMVDESKHYQCHLCDKTYRNERSRTIHLKTVHLNEKPFQCPVCEKAFACQSYLTEHRKIHFCLDRFRCSLCDKTFSSNKVLKRHFRIHTGEKPFKCEYCDKRFAAASNLSEHRTLHTGRMPYTCTGCAGKFRLWTTLKKHTVKCDGVRPGNVKEKGENTTESPGDGLESINS